MAKTATKFPAPPKKKETPLPSHSCELQPLDRLREGIDHLFEDFRRGTWQNPFLRKSFDLEPFWQRELSWGGVPAVNIAEKDDALEITAELPGMEEKDIDVQFSDGTLVITGEKKEEKEEKKKGYYLSERHFGAFHRSFRMPESVDADSIDAQFKNGVLTVSLPKSAEAKKRERKIKVITS